MKTQDKISSVSFQSELYTKGRIGERDRVAPDTRMENIKLKIIYLCKSFFLSRRRVYAVLCDMQQR